MAIRRVTLEYTVYPPNYRPQRDSYRDVRTFRRARAVARGLGVGAMIYCDFQQNNKRPPLGDWWTGKVLQWDGKQFRNVTCSAAGVNHRESYPQRTSAII